jgi:exodeoxyribonuclease V alpha subunit
MKCRWSIISSCAILVAFPRARVLMLVGDVDQLPSVGPGNVLRDLIDSGRIRLVRLIEIYRQARESRINVNAHRVNDGRMPLLEEDSPDFRFVEIEKGEEALAWIKSFLAGEIRERYGLDPVRDVQVIA